MKEGEKNGRRKRKENLISYPKLSASFGYYLEFTFFGRQPPSASLHPFHLLFRTVVSSKKTVSVENFAQCLSFLEDDRKRQKIGVKKETKNKASLLAFLALPFLLRSLIIWRKDDEDDWGTKTVESITIERDTGHDCKVRKRVKKLKTQIR